MKSPFYVSGAHDLSLHLVWCNIIMITLFPDFSISQCSVTWEKWLHTFLVSHSKSYYRINSRRKSFIEDNLHGVMCFCSIHARIWISWKESNPGRYIMVALTLGYVFNVHLYFKYICNFFFIFVSWVCKGLVIIICIMGIVSSLSG